MIAIRSLLVTDGVATRVESRSILHCHTYPALGGTLESDRSVDPVQNIVWSVSSSPRQIMEGAGQPSDPRRGQMCRRLLETRRQLRLRGVRRDTEDMGAWTPVAYFSDRAFTTEDEARAAANYAVPWLLRLLDH